MPDTNANTSLAKFTQIVQAASGLSIIVGIIVALAGLYGTLRNIDASVTTERLTTLAAMKQFIDDDVAVAQQTERFIASGYGNKQKLRDLISQKGSGKAAYYSDELVDMRAIAHHYEVLATLVRLNYVDFTLVYQTIPFPDDFWSVTEDFRKELQTKNWSNGHGLPDFLVNTEYL